MIQLLDIKTVLKRVAIGRTKLYALVAQRNFPQPLKIGRHTRWLETEVEAWVADLAERRSQDWHRDL